MSTIGIAILGCGGRAKFVARRTCLVDKRLKIIGGYDVDSSQVESTRRFFAKEPPYDAEKYSHDVTDIKEYESVEACVNDTDVDWVMIGSWNSKHCEHAIAAFEAGKHVFCEKPLATNLEDCLAMRDAWKKSGKSFTIGFTLRYAPLYRRIKELLENGAIGNIVSMEFNETLEFNHGGMIHANWRRFTKNAGTHLLEKCSHDVDLVNWMVGSRVSRAASFSGLNFFIPENARHMERLPKSSSGATAYCLHGNSTPFTRDKDICDNQVIILEYENDVRATFHLNCNAAIPERRMYILGTEGAIRADVLTGNLERKRIGFDTKQICEHVGDPELHGGGDDILAKELSDCMLTGVPPAATLDDGLSSAVACFGIDQADTTGNVVDLSELWSQVDEA